MSSTKPVTIDSTLNYINQSTEQAGLALSGTYDSSLSGDFWVEFTTDGGSQSWFKATASGGHWSLSLTAQQLATLGNGAYSVTAGLYQSPGGSSHVGAHQNALEGVATKAITIDAAPPVIDTLTQSASGDWTNSTCDTITVTAHDATSGVVGVEIYDNGKDLGAASLVSGQWIYKATGLADGSHKLTAVATDNAGNHSSSTLSATDKVDATAPLLDTLMQSASGDWTQSDSDTITVTAHDATSGVQGVDIYDNGIKLGAASLVNGQWVYNATGLADGTHTLTAVATDNAGNHSNSALSATDQVDHTAPVIDTLTQMASGEWTQSDSDTVTVTAHDATSGVKGVEIYDNGNDLGAAKRDDSGNWVFDASKLADGTHALTAVATDNAGNQSSSTLSATDKVDHTPPVIDTLDHSAGDKWATSTNDTVTVTAHDATSGLKGIEIFDNGNDLGAASQDDSGNWVFDASKLADGTHTLTAVATDNAGNTSESALSVTDKVDTTPPVIDTLDQGADGKWTTSTSDKIIVTAHDATSDVTGVVIYDNGTKLDAATQDDSGNWVYTATGLADGTHTLTAIATDSAGNISESTLSVTDKVDTTPPVIDTLDQSANGQWTTSHSDTITVAAHDATSDVTVVDIYDNGTKLGAASVDLTTGDWIYNATALADGAHTLTAIATDSAGNTSESTLSVTDKVDGTPPVIDTLTQSASGQWTNSHSDTITVTAHDATSGVAGVEIYDNGHDLGAATLDDSGNWVFNATGLADGSHAFTAKATDNAGNQSSSALSVTDKIATPPTLGPITEAHVVGTGNNGTADFSFTVSTTGPSIDHFVYWIDKIQNETSAPSGGTSTAPGSGIVYDNSGVGTETIRANYSNHVGDYFHVEAIDTLGHASAVDSFTIF
jgi:hypothetical protein